MSQRWHCFVAEDDFARPYVLLQLGDDEQAVEEFAFFTLDESDTPEAASRIAESLERARHECLARNAALERSEINSVLDEDKKATS